MVKVWITFALYFLSFSFILSEDIIQFESTIDGDSDPSLSFSLSGSESNEVSSQLVVNVVNGYDFPIEVYYDDNEGGMLLVSLLSLSLYFSLFLIIFRWNWMQE